MKTERQRAEDTAWRWFSRWVRISDKHNQINGADIYCKCYTTGRYYYIKEIQAGHFISRGHHSVKYNPMNCKPQSVYANKWKNGMPMEFRSALVREYGSKVVESLERQGAVTVKHSIPELRDIAKKYRILVREKESQLGVKVW